MSPMSPRLLRPRASGGFTPRTISGLALWLDAADSASITASSGVATEWRDKSGNGVHFSQTSGNDAPATGTATMNGRNVLVFNGTNTSLSRANALSVSSPMTWFFVQRVVSSAAFAMTYSVGSGSGFEVRQDAANTNGRPQFSPGGLIVTDASTWVGATNIFSLTYSTGVNLAAHRNGAAMAGTFATTQPNLSGTHFIGRRTDGFYANVQVAEILLYSSALTATQRQTVFSYLGRKWGITVA
jgi:hypothetical protein